MRTFDVVVRVTVSGNSGFLQVERLVSAAINAHAPSLVAHGAMAHVHRVLQIAENLNEVATDHAQRKDAP